MLDDQDDGQGGSYEDCEMIAADLESPFVFDD